MHPMRVLALALALCGLGACSPYSFSKEVAAMSDGVDKLSDAFATGYDSLAADRAARLQTAMIDTRPRVVVAPSCERSTVRPDSVHPCALYIAGTNPPELSAAEKTRARTLTVVRKLRNYANALAAVTNAKDRDAYDAAVAQLAGAVGAVSAPADAMMPGVSTLAPAMVNVFGWVVGTALDQQRFASLRQAVNMVGTPLPDEKNENPTSPIRVVTGALGEGLEMLKSARLAVLQGEAVALTDGLNKRTWSDDAYRRRLTDTQSVLAVIAALQRSDPTGAASDLAAAHDKLVLAVNDAATNYTGLIAALGEFYDKVSAVHAALTTMSTPSPAKKGN